MQNTIRHGGSIAAYTAHDKCPQAQTNVSRAEAEASGASEKLWLRMQNNRQAGGKPCENQNNFFIEYFDPTRSSKDECKTGSNKHLRSTDHFRK